MNQFSLDNSFLGTYQKLAMDTMIPYQEMSLCDEIPDVPKSHAMENFRIAADYLKNKEVPTEEFFGMVFQDSDVAKWLEAAAYSLANREDPILSLKVDKVVALVASAQQENGYLNTYFTIQEPGGEWEDLREAHELYCAGHMMEAAVALYEAAGKPELLGVMRRMADHIYDTFITKKHEGYPGHPEVELALVRLYRATGEKRYLELAKHFIDVRGVDSEFFKKEEENRDFRIWGSFSGDTEYYLCHKPVREMTVATGHAVRAVYLYSGMCDVAKETGDNELFLACKRLFTDIIEKQMYVTGAIGSQYEGESFTKGYNLPNDTCYGETCAAVGLAFFARRMLSMELDSRYADTMERALYNCVLAGLELDGKRFFYVNPLESIPGIAGETGSHNHTLPERCGWFACACCPPNVARLLTSISEYTWTVENHEVVSHLYIGGNLVLPQGSISVETDYPREGRVFYHLKPNAGQMELKLRIRIPGWCEQATFIRNGVETAPDRIENGYAWFDGAFTEEIIELVLPMAIRRVYCNPSVSADSGRVCFMRGPLVYCAEGIDNEGKVVGKFVAREGECKLLPEMLVKGHKVLPIEVEGRKQAEMCTLYTFTKPTYTECSITLLPYYAWTNRGRSEMRVWLPEL